MPPKRTRLRQVAFNPLKDMFRHIKEFLKPKKEFSVRDEADKNFMNSSFIVRIKKCERDINYLVKHGQMEEEDALKLWEKPLEEKEKILDDIFSQADLQADRTREEDNGENLCEKPHNNCQNGEGGENCTECTAIRLNL